MDIFEWSIKIIDSLTWPITVIILVYLLKKPLTDLLPSLNKLKYKGFEIEFSKKIKEVSNEVKALPELLDISQTKQATNRMEKLTNEVTEVGKVSPLAAITLAWSELEREINITSHRLGMQAKSRAAPTNQKCLNMLLDSDKLSRDEMRLIMKMKKLYNEAIHRANELSYLTSDDVLNYLDNVILLVNRLGNIK